MSTWTGSIEELGQRLHQEAWAAKGRKVWYLLPRGLLIAMWVDRRDLRKRLRLARRQILAADQEDAWRREVRVALGALGCGDWYAEEAWQVDRQAAVVLVEPKLRDEFVGCDRCRRPAPKSPHKEPLCTQCAIELGRQEVGALAGSR